MGIGVLGLAGAAAYILLPGEAKKPSPETAKGQFYDLTPNPRVKSGMELRPIDHEIFDAINKFEFKRTDLSDLFPDKPYRVQLIGHLPDRWINVVLIDLDRDGKWDEKWDLKKESVVRYTFEEGDEERRTPWALRPGPRWLPY